jgi:anhydro-N-acetylmuramic acid kinase
MEVITALGIMSGTSVDGLDIVAAEFKFIKGAWTYRILKSEFIPYPGSLRNTLLEAIYLNGEELITLDQIFGEYIGDRILNFCNKQQFKADLIASHGHTVFHQPDRGITLQIGNGQTIYQKTNIRVINDFRKIDVLRGGQGAPLVPVGDKFLFGEFDFCLNIGGFSNISFDNSHNQRLAYDVGPANIILNYLAGKIGKSYDDKGSLARNGNVLEDLLNDLNALPYYSSDPPKSLGLEWVKKNIVDRISRSDSSLKDLMRTLIEHIAFQIDKSIKTEIRKHSLVKDCKILVTGGGAYNDFLVNRLENMSDGFFYVIPEREIIEFKEALIFAFLGVLRFRNEINIWKSVTGAKQDSCGGTIHDYS